MMSTTEFFLDHERLEVYGLAREHAREAHRLIQILPSGRADVADQYRRASLSIPLNIAEGGGEYAPAEKARFYRMAKRSATECAAVLDHMVDLQMLPEREIHKAKTLLRRIVGALIKLILATERMTSSRETASTSAHARKRVRVP
jgi:four helix bundle protein